MRAARLHGRHHGRRAGRDLGSGLDQWQSCGPVTGETGLQEGLCKQQGELSGPLLLHGVPITAPEQQRVNKRPRCRWLYLIAQ